MALIAILLAGGCGDGPAPAASSGRTKPEAVEAALGAAAEYLETDEPAKAEAILARLIEREPREPRARELLGRALLIRAARADERGDRAGAVQTRREAYAHYREALGIGGSSAGLEQSAGVVAMTAGERAAALDHFTRAEALAPRNPQHPLYAAQVLIQLDRRDEARDAIARVLALDPDEPAAPATLAMIDLADGRFDEALTRIAEARAIAPRDTRFQVQEARIHRLRGAPRDAVERLAGLPPDVRASLEIATELSAAYTALGEHEGAVEAWAHAWRQRAHGSAGWDFAARAGRAAVEAGLWEEARRWLHLARLDAPPGSAELRELEEAIER